MGLRDFMKDDYIVVGKIMGKKDLSKIYKFIENSKLPQHVNKGKIKTKAVTDEL